MVSRRGLFRTMLAVLGAYGLTSARSPRAAPTEIKLPGDVPDHHDARFRAGRVGLWTKADSVTAFSDLVIRGVKT